MSSLGFDSRDSVLGLPNPGEPRRKRRRRKKKESSGGILDSVVHNPVTKVVGNLADDVKDAAVGIPMGIVKLASSQGKDIWSAAHGDLDFDRSRKLYGAIASGTWHTWSPLFAGAGTKGDFDFTKNFAKWGKQTYDHPLAPLLDVATVFSGGATGAVKGAQVLGKLGATGKAVEKVSALDKGRAITLTDPTDKGRRVLERQLSERPGRRLLQEALLSKDRIMPQWYTTGKNRRQYEHEWTKHEAGEGAAKQHYTQAAAQTLAIINGGKALSNGATKLDAYTAVFSSMHANLALHAPSRVLDGPAKFSKAHHERYVKKLEEPEIREMFNKAISNGHDPDKVFSNLGNIGTTRHLKEAMRNEKGEALVITKGDAWKLGEEAVKSSKLMKTIYHNPTTLWKIIQVGYAPRTIVNNGIGNWLLFTARQGGHGAMRGIYDAMRMSVSERKLRKGLGEEGGFAKWADSLENRHFADQMGNTFGAEMGFTFGKKSKKQRLASGLHPIVHATSEKPVRRAAMAAYLRNNSEVKAYAKQHGVDWKTAASRVLDENPALHARATNHINTIAGDYRTIKGWEKPLKDLVPFYLWNRHIAKTTGNMVLDTPGRVAVATRLSQMGIEETEEALGNLPEFLRGVIPLGRDGKRASVMLTHSLNPFATIGEMVDAGKAVTVGDSTRGGATLLGQVNPFATAGLEQLTGRNILTGAPVESHGGALSSLLYNVTMETPPLMLAKAIKDDTARKGPTGKDFLYTKGEGGRTALSLLGFPTRDMSLAKAEELSRKEKGVKKGRRARRKEIAAVLPKTWGQDTGGAF